MAQETFSNRLRQTMADRDVRQSDVIRASEMLGKKLGKSQMSQYVSGKTIPRRDVAELLARILEVDVTWLLAGDADQGDALSPRNVSKPEPNPSAQIARSVPMRTFSKSTKLDNVLYDVRGPVVDEAARMEDEGERILKHLRDGAFVVALAIEGDQLTSEQLAARIAQWGLHGVSHLQFVIGGSLGLDPRVLRRANMPLSFSKMTFPHQLMRVILLEQIYRAFKINAHEPYHK